MSSDILSQYGRNSSQPQAASASSGGYSNRRDINTYHAPVGPKGIMDPKSPGLHGTNHGIENSADMGGSHSGSPGLGGTNHGCCGTQGKY